ncbi:hypothetical protein E8L99_10865 [Phreatobacter aquaticus]|uniref:Haem-binding uptake Tiki superfamily ChaN domain-containing protein n=1 Tax=Phreatobacter aquaticus TaxID=2570229 RepID=A0A4D7QKK0_9HYPH|nr:ChaN family lipoprotein [Phreatobacter aquaticus]QCK86219.1 hypothetical protein E8L99_10865 [Phreatobacter aquaticus]
MIHQPATWLDPRSGTVLDQGTLMAELAQKQVVLIGESHDVAEIHRWQLHVAVMIAAHNPNIALGFEMFPRRVQPVLDHWVAGAFDTRAFLEASEWQTVWGFPPEIYLPLFHFCRQQRVPMLALNCHRPLVTRVGKDGWDAIPEAERDGLTPSATATPAYRRYLFDLTGAGGRAPGPTGPVRSPDDPGFDRFVRAQQCWDRAFACNIARARAVPEPPLVIGIIGRGHLEYGHGTPFQLADLGIRDVAVLLPNEAETLTIEPDRQLADAVFRLDVVDPRLTRQMRPRLVAG